MKSLCALALLALALPAKQLPLQVFTSAHGLPRNFVTCLAPGPTGLLWLCTSEGLVRFDGYRFRVFGAAHGLPSRTIMDFVPSRGGGFWLVTDRGICRLLPGAQIGSPCRLLPVDRPSGEFTTRCLLEAPNGDLWAATTNALFHLPAGARQLRRTAFHVLPTEDILKLAAAPDGALLVGTELGLYEFRPDRAAAEAQRSLTAPAIAGTLDLLPLPSGEILLASTTGLYRLLRPPSGPTLRKAALPGMPAVNRVLRRRDGAIWIAGSGGLMRLSLDPDGEVRAAAHYTEAEGLPARVVTSFVEDAQGNLWGATDGSGVFRIEDSGFAPYSEKDGLESTRIGAIFEDHAGRLCVQTRGGPGLALFLEEDGRFKRVPVRLPAAAPAGLGLYQSLLPARNGEWWAGTAQGLLRFPKLSRTEDLARVLPARAPLACAEASHVFEDSAGDVWISCVSPNRDLTRWQRGSGQFQRWPPVESAAAVSLPQLMRNSPSNALWIGTGSGVLRFREGRFEAFPLTPGPRMPIVRDILFDRAGRLWIATRRAGLFRCDNPDASVPAFRSYTVREGLATDSVNSLTEDSSGLIYAGTAVGVDRIDPRGPADAPRIRHFTAAEGLPSSEQVTSFRDRRGHLWFGSISGLVEFDPSQARPQPPPEVYLTGVRVRGEEVALPWEGARSLSLDLAASRNQVEIEYAGVNLQSAASLRYQYRLRGVDKDWSAPLAALSVNYASLPRGRSRFEVRAVDAEGRTGAGPAGFDVYVEPPLWLQAWFLMAAAALVVGAAAVLYNYRVRQLLAVERLRTRIAADLHDDIGASLTQISILSELARRGPSPQVLSDIAGIAREMVGDMSDIVWAINPRHDRFDGLIHRMRRFASDTLAGPNIELEFEVEGLPEAAAVPLETRRPLYLVFKEVVNNVARHSGAGRASIRLERQRGAVTLTIQDDGRGFRPPGPHTGDGLASIARRMRDLGGSAQWDSRPGEGTRFTAVFPPRARMSLAELMVRDSEEAPLK